jgi:hypothetical protein
MGHIPEYFLQEVVNDKYKKFLVKHAKIPEELFNSVAWNLFAQAKPSKTAPGTQIYQQ